jgi:uncharacterized protein YgbK (DUF1537 family)
MSAPPDQQQPDQHLPEGLLVSWYGDDFTGSAAVMEALSFAGLGAVLFLGIPTAEQLRQFPGVRGIGIAGTARSRSPLWMEDHLPEVFEFLAGLGAGITQYKVCSTFDSSASAGSIGKAIDIAVPILGGQWIPLLPAAPTMGRYQSFGHLYATAPGGVFRLDRHPVMARHPVTPMDESDVRVHLARQTSRPMGLVDLQSLQTPERASQSLANEVSGGAEVIALDAVDDRTLEAAGRLIWENRGERIFTVGSQGIEYALVRHWQEAGLIETVAEPGATSPAARMAVVSGSVSQITKSQIDWALDHGFEGIAFQVEAVAGQQSDIDQAIENAVAASLRAIQAGRDPLVFTARGPDDPAFAACRAAIANAGLEQEEGSRRLGRALGRVLDGILRRSGIRRAVISGGDTSGFAMEQLGVYALTALAPTIPGAALFNAHASDPVHDGLQIALKGGQMGTTDFFSWVKKGGGAANRGD